MLIVANERSELLPLLPTGGVVVEIGVNVGDFSRRILDLNRPQRLHLIDPWEVAHADDEYVASGESAERQMAGAEQRYQETREKVAAEVAAGSVEIHRDYSFNVADRFADNSLDWIYIDGNHQYDAVKKDLEVFYPKIKPDGFILGHDYANHERARRHHYGVVEAVNEFVLQHGAEFCCLTMEAFPTFVIAKSPSSERKNAFLTKILHTLNPTFRVLNFERKAYQQFIVERPDGKAKTIISID
ncbi:MAG: class I SAM-dependent methyltransferase [Rhodospirillales bacterium]|nr:class I SAM-dependent methyltransferase [Rhodospirillales bacterium]